MQVEPRAKQRQDWPPEMHLRQIDTDIDTLESGVNEGFEKLARQMERNRQTMWKVLTLVLGVAGLTVTVVAFLTQGN